VTATILQKIGKVRLGRLETEKRTMPIGVLEARASERPPPLDFLGAFSGPGIHIMAEVKKASPSRGLLAEDFDPSGLALTYESGGAAAVSVLTEQDHFMGSMGFLELVRKAVSLPVLRKDFITDPYQVVEARAAGADSFLLIAGFIDATWLGLLIHEGRKWGMEPLVEIHDETQLENALNAGARLIGINNRDLTTFRVDLEVSLRLATLVPQDVTIISESGIRSREDVMHLAEAGIRGFLVGESLVTSSDPAAKIRELIHGA
jgi:indole-3-glycerol phosphate synthase